MDVLLASGIFAIVFVPTMVFLASSLGTAELNRLAMRRMAPELALEEIGIARRRRPRSGRVGRWLETINIVGLLEENMMQAGLYMALSRLLVFLLLLFGIGVASFAFFWHDALYSLAGGLALAALPILYIRALRRRRIKAFAKQLPFALDLIKSSLQAGHTLQRAFQVLVAEFGPPLNAEFRTVLEQNRIGLPFPRALEELYDRVPEENLRLLVVAVKVQAEAGSSLAEVAGRLSELVRARDKMRMQVSAMTAQARFGGILVGLLPFVVLGIFSTIEPNYARMLFRDPSGLKILKTGLIMDAVACVWIRQMLKMRY